MQQTAGRACRLVPLVKVLPVMLTRNASPGGSNDAAVLLVTATAAPLEALLFVKLHLLLMTAYNFAYTEPPSALAAQEVNDVCAA